MQCNAITTYITYYMSNLSKYGRPYAFLSENTDVIVWLLRERYNRNL